MEIPQILSYLAAMYFFSATTATTVTGTESYKTNGTSSGTVLMKDINLAASDSNPPNLIVLTPNVMVFGAIDGTTGVELFKTDGTASGTINVIDYPGTLGSIQWIETLGTNAIMGQMAGTIGLKLYKSDGTMTNSYTIYVRKDMSPINLFFSANPSSKKIFRNNQYSQQECNIFFYCLDKKYRRFFKLFFILKWY